MAEVNATDMATSRANVFGVWAPPGTSFSKPELIHRSWNRVWVELKLQAKPVGVHSLNGGVVTNLLITCIPLLKLFSFSQRIRQTCQISKYCPIAQNKCQLSFLSSFFQAVWYRGICYAIYSYLLKTPIFLHQLLNIIFIHCLFITFSCSCFCRQRYSFQLYSSLVGSP